ncbi:peptidoglycan-binding protein [Gottfriedia acidiceleris]
MNYKVAAQIIENAGYATDPNYAEKLIGTIEKNNLTLYDTVPYPGKFMKKGSKNKYVGMVQRKLGINDDNIYGEKTLAAVKAFQEKKGLVVDGVVSEKTWIKIFK